VLKSQQATRTLLCALMISIALGQKFAVVKVIAAMAREALIITLTIDGGQYIVLNL